MNKINPSIEFGMLSAFMDNVLRMVTAARTCKNVAITFTRYRFMSNGDTECNMVQSIEMVLAHRRIVLSCRGPSAHPQQVRLSCLEQVG